MVKQKRFETIVGSKLGRCHKYGTHTIRPYTTEETTPAFLTGHSDKTIDGMAVVSPLGGRQGRVMLHSNVEDVRGIASYATEEA